MMDDSYDDQNEAGNAGFSQVNNKPQNGIQF
jgi:hypothetical protein